MPGIGSPQREITVDSSPQTIDPQEALASIEAAFEHLRAHFFGRDAVLEQILYALLTKEHALIIGDRGLAKSRLARSVFAQFEATRPPFSLQLTRSTSVGQLVGGLDLVAFERGTYIHNLDGYIVKANFAFLDELFDANDFVLRALNGILNEREFLNGPQIEPAVLHTAIGTTNFIRDTRESRAVLDRLLFKCVVHRAESTLERFAIRREFITSHGGTVNAASGKAIPYAYLNKLSRIIQGESPNHSIKAPPHILVMLDQIISDFEKEVSEKRSDERFVYSDRSKNKAIHVVMASALRSGRTTAEVRDLAALRFLIPTVGSRDEEEVFNHALDLTVKAFTSRDRESVDQAAAIVDLVQEAVERHRLGTLNEPNWSERMKTRFGKWIHRDSSLTLSSLMEEARALSADHAVMIKLKEEVLAKVRDAHEKHHIAFEQKL
ncbi:MAG: AAA family ATPase [Fimbriimonadaceae bacterium]|nr:AAA family ATPase [Fimbriimonadaceae bacterium]